MSKFELRTEIKATIDICFDLSRSIDFHLVSVSNTKEKAVAGRTSGLIELNETVTWEATHFAVRQQLTSIISGFEFPFYFKDEQLKGAFKSFSHEHFFEQDGDTVIMIDVFEFESPFGVLGHFFNWLILNSYMKRFLTKRNEVIREYAESDKWKLILN